jgi:hypothetical protein
MAKILVEYHIPPTCFGIESPYKHDVRYEYEHEL